MSPAAAAPLGTRAWIETAALARLPEASREWLARARAELAAGVADERLCALISVASRHVPRRALAPSAAERAAARALLEGFEPERWTLLEAVRVLLVLAHPEIGATAGQRALEEAFRYTDVGEACALYRALVHLPDPKRFAWRAGEGCRSSMGAVFEAAACDTPFPFLYFDAIAWRQCVVKALFVGAPLARVHGLERRLDAELARMVLDLADERRAAGRPVPSDTWICLGAHAGERGRASLQRELESGSPEGRAAAERALAAGARH